MYYKRRISYMCKLHVYLSHLGLLFAYALICMFYNSKIFLNNKYFFTGD